MDSLPNTIDDLPGIRPSFDANADGDFDDLDDIANVYSIRIPSFATQVPTLVPTLNDNDGITSNMPLLDIRDSDGIIVANDLVVTFTSGSAGDNNHTLDFAFITPTEEEETPGETTVTLDGIIWFDINQNGLQDVNEHLSLIHI